MNHKRRKPRRDTRCKAFDFRPLGNGKGRRPIRDLRIHPDNFRQRTTDLSLTPTVDY